MQQRIPCVRARQSREFKLRHDVNLAAATALWRGSSDCTHRNAAEGDLVMEGKGREGGEEADLPVPERGGPWREWA